MLEHKHCVYLAELLLYNCLVMNESREKRQPATPASQPSRGRLMDISVRQVTPVSQSSSEPDFTYDRKSRKTRVTKTKRLSWPKKISIAVVALLFLGGGAFAAKTYFSLNKVIQRNTGVAAAGLKDEVDLGDLKGEGDGRVNILFLGVGDSGHAGADLSDTIMVASIDPRTNDVAMLGIPRDLYVKIPGHGYDKINSAHAFGEQTKKGGGPELAKQVVSQTLGIPVHYYVRADFTGLKKAIDSLGGVDIKVEQALYDPEYPCDKDEGRACGMRIAAGAQHMDGATALKFVRCRKGNCGDDFGRAKRQQQVLVAMREKALQISTITNPAKISELIGVVGDHLRTDLQVWEIKKLVEIGQKIDPTKIINNVLDNGPGGLVTTTNYGGASVVIPTAGNGNFTAIQEFVRSIFVDGYIKQEAAAIEVQNGTTKYAVASQLATLLKSYRYNVIKTSVADSTNYQQTMIYDYSGGKKPFTLKYLENRFGVKAKQVEPSASPTPSGSAKSSQQNVDIRIIVGTDYKPTPTPTPVR